MGIMVEEAGHWPSNNPIETADSEGSGFQLVHQILRKTHPEAVTVPFLVVGATDSKHYKDLTNQIIRFVPLVLNTEDIASIHGINEKVSLKNLGQSLEFYNRLFRKL